MTIEVGVRGEVNIVFSLLYSNALHEAVKQINNAGVWCGD